MTPGRMEANKENSGVLVGETKTTSSAGDVGYKTEFVKVYQDAGVVGLTTLTLLVLCCLLGLFCTRLIKMYTALTESRDALEQARTTAIEKLTTSLLLLRTDTTAVVTELKREHEFHAATLERVGRLAEAAKDRNEKAISYIENLILRTGENREIASSVYRKMCDLEADMMRILVKGHLEPKFDRRDKTPRDSGD